MKSGGTFVRETIALRQRKAKDAGRILALQGQNPGQLSFELIRSSERICPEPRCALAFSVLELSLERTVQPDFILSSYALRNQTTAVSPSPLTTTFPRDERLIQPTSPPVRRPYRRRPHLLLNYSPYKSFFLNTDTEIQTETAISTTAITGTIFRINIICSS